jgi:tetrahydromethanopterin S-methyltransferase subunit F
MSIPSPKSLEMFEQKIDTLRLDFDSHVTLSETRYLQTSEQLAQIAISQQKNVDAIGSLVEETRDIVQLHKDLKVVTRIGAGVQSFGLWMLKWPLIGAGAYAAFEWIISHLPKG